METIEELARRIAAGHAFDDHVVKEQEFQRQRYGEPFPIRTREELQQHIVGVMENSETLCATVFQTRFQKAQAELLYHPLTNTLVIVPANPANEPTVYRPLEGIALFYLKLEQARRAEQRQITVVNSIYELRPELAAAKEAQRIKEADEKLRADIEQRLAKEKEDMQQRHRRELQHSPDRARDGKRHAAELRDLERKKEGDFQRYRREREAARTLRDDLEKKERERQNRRQIDGPELGGRGR